MENFGSLPVAVNATWRRLRLFIMLFLCGMALSRTAKAQSIKIDGNPIDWTGKFTDPAYNPRSFVVDGIGPSDTGATGGSSKDNLPLSGWQWTTGQVTPAKDNIENTGLLLRGDTLFFCFDRLETSGDANYGLWVFKNAVSVLPGGGFSGTHTNGDLFITMTFTNGGGVGTPVVYRWSDTVNTIVLVPTDSTKAQIATNLTGYPIVWPYTGDSTAGFYKSNAFLEGLVLLSAVGERDLCFSTFIIDSRTSQSISVIKDFAIGTFASRPIVAVNDDTVCAGQDAVFTAVVTGGIPPITYSWNGVLPFAAANTFTVSAATVNTVVTVQAKGSNGCISVADTGHLKVNATPTVTAPADRAYCNGAKADSIHFNGTPAGVTFSWTGTSNIGFPTSGTGTIGVYTATNTSSVTVTDTIIVTPSANGCTGKPDTILVTVYPTPRVNTTRDTAYCNNTIAAAITFSGSPGNVTYSWTSNANVGFGTSGTVNPIPSYTATNTTSVTVTARVIVTPSANGCTGTPDTFLITVYPTPTVAAHGDTAYCNHAAAAGITFSGTPNPGVSFSWTGTKDVGFGTSGNTNIDPYTATNNGTTTVIDTIIVTPSANGCTGRADTFLVTVYPTPSVVPTRDTAYCNKTVAAAIPFNGTPNPGVSFSWTGTRDIGFGTSGSTSIGVYTATNNGTTTVVDTVIVTPSANGCTGKADTFLITVYPTPNVFAHGDTSYCPNVLADSIHFAGNVVGSVFNWTGTIDIGFNTSGSGTIPHFITVGGASARRDTVIVIPTANGCIGRADTFVVTINPNPGPNAPQNPLSACPGASIDTTHIASLDPTVITHWTGTTDLGFGLSGTGNLPPFIADNPTAVPIVDTITVKSTTTSGCPSPDSVAFTITINPNPNANAPIAPFAICSGATHDTIDIPGLDLVDTFKWTSSVDIGFGTSGQGKIPAFTATVTPVQIIATVTVTVVSPTGCITPGDGFIVTVNPLPVVVARDTSICAGVSFSLNLLSNPLGGTWSGSGVSGTTFSSAGLSGKIGLLYTFSDANSCTNSDSAYVTILANPVVVARDTSICAGVSFSLNLISSPVGGTWFGSGVSGTTFNSSGLSGTIGLLYVYSNGAGCSGSDSAYITINPLPTVIARDTSICAGVSFSLNLISSPLGGTWSGTGASGTTFSSSGLAAGKHGLLYTYTNGNGCTASDSAYVTINALPTVVARDTSVCSGVSFSLTLIGTPGGGSWTGTGVSGNTFTGQPVGKYGLLYTYTNGNGCTSSDSAYVTVTSCGNIFATFTQGFWGSPGKHCDGAGTNRTATSLINYLLNLYGPITVGLPGIRSVIIPVTAATTVNSVMPGGHTPNKLTVAGDVLITSTTFATNYLTGGRINNVFLSQVIALRLGTRIVPGLLGFPIVYNPAGNSRFQTCGTTTTDCAKFTVSGGCSCWTLSQSVTRYVTKGGTKAATLANLLSLADSLLGGALIPGTTVGGYVVPSYANVSDAIDLFNNAFDNFKSFPGSYGCPSAKTPVAASGNDEDLESAMLVYPNPTTGTFTIEIPAIDKDAHITVVDLNGRTIKTVTLQANTFAQTQQIDLPAVTPGLYIIHVENNGHLFAKKLMVE